MYRGLPSARRDNLSVAAAAASKVLCLPIYPALEQSQVEMIARQITDL
jgi:dTDP-4-amino-4,6-dideoxygalactose transaminase